MDVSVGNRRSAVPQMPQMCLKFPKMSLKCPKCRQTVSKNAQRAQKGVPKMCLKCPKCRQTVSKNAPRAQKGVPQGDIVGQIAPPLQEKARLFASNGVYLRAFCFRARRRELVKRRKSVGVAPQSTAPRQWPRYQKSILPGKKILKKRPKKRIMKIF